tara:strand:+ start:1218 stop:1517 length:300 start_codon:yes stop_codon:yes gene_type:complete
VAKAKKEILERLGDFTVYAQIGRHYLYHEKTGTDIAVCINADYQERYGSIYGWLKNIKKRETKRINKIEEQINELNSEMRDRTALVVACENLLEDGDES